jgi:hypothetical protein
MSWLRGVIVVAIATACAAGVSAVAAAAGSWCLGLSGLGPVRAGMSLDEVLRLADFRGLERRQPSGDCWYLHYDGNGADFDLMIIGGRVARIEIKGGSALRTFSGARIGSTEKELQSLYGGRLDVQPHKYDGQGRTITFKAADGLHGLRFETSAGRVRAMQAGHWEHLHYVEGCS